MSEPAMPIEPVGDLKAEMRRRVQARYDFTIAQIGCRHGGMTDGTALAELANALRADLRWVDAGAPLAPKETTPAR